jgi:hypothetical protein
MFMQHFVHGFSIESAEYLDMTSEGVARGGDSGSTDVPTLLGVVTRVLDIAATAEAALRVKDAEDRAALMEREALERVLRVEAENDTAFASACEDVEALSWKITLLKDELAVERQSQEVSQRERQEQFEEITLLQTRGSELCHAIIGPPWVMHHLFEGMRLAALCHTEMVGELATLHDSVYYRGVGAWVLA